VEVPIGEHMAEASSGIAATMARSDALDVFNIGIGYEGITACRKIFALAELHGISTLLGSTVEMSIGTAAAAHLVAAVPNLDLPIYPAGPLVYREQVVKERVRYDEGHIIVPEGPGLGMELDEKLLDAQRL
jgi:muconate cycloisomerase